MEDLNDIFGSSSSSSSSSEERKLGIDIGSQLKPLSPEEAAELRSEGRKIIKDAFGSRINELEGYKKPIKKDMQRNQKNTRYGVSIEFTTRNRQIIG